MLTYEKYEIIFVVKGMKSGSNREGAKKTGEYCSISNRSLHNAGLALISPPIIPHW